MVRQMTPNEIDTPLAQASIVMAIPAHTTLEGSARERRTDLVRATLGICSMVGLAAAALWIMSPFIPALVWAAMIVVATWPLMLRLQARVAHKRCSRSPS